MTTRKLYVEILGTVRRGAFSPAVPGVGVLLEPGLFTLGSDPTPKEGGSILVLKHGTVSRNHAELYPAGTGWTLRDLFSDNGVVLFHESMDFATPTDIALRTGCPLPVDFAAYAAERVTEVSIQHGPRTLALGGVVLRLALAAPPRGRMT